MTYATTLIIPFRFDCNGNGIDSTDALIRQQGTAAAFAQLG